MKELCRRRPSLYNRPLFDLPRGLSADNLITKRLDRILVDSRARLLWPSTCVCHLSKFASDHTPLLLQLKPRVIWIKQRRPFRFEAAWQSHPNFDEFLRSNWKGDIHTADALSHLRHKLTGWNVEIFGNIHKCKAKILEDLDRVQISLEEGVKDALIQRNKELQAEIELVLHQEEVLWLQKSRENWLRDGDRNTSFFHASTIIRRRRNKIDTLQNANGTTSRRLADRKIHKFEKNITKRGSVPETTLKKGNDYPVGPILLGFFVFVVIGSFGSSNILMSFLYVGSAKGLTAHKLYHILQRLGCFNRTPEWSSRGMSEARVKGNTVIPPTRQGAHGNLGPLPGDDIICNKAIHLARPQRHHQQPLVPKARHGDILPVKLQAPRIWHSVNLLPQERHLLKLPHAHTRRRVPRQQAHQHHSPPTLRQPSVPRARRVRDLIVPPSPAPRVVRHHPFWAQLQEVDRRTDADRL
ncbi:hypothetical protein V2J09_013222 [Rumex salicifolius]